MKSIPLNVTALSPLAIRADHAPGGAATAPYITGTTLLGGLAAAYRQFYPDQEREFERLFLSGQVHFPNLYPASFKQEDAQKAAGLPVYPIPKTAQSCKRFPGFKGDVADDSPHGARDSLFDWAAFKLGDEVYTALALLNEHKSCGCGKAMHHFDGYYRRMKKEQGHVLAQAKVDTRLQTHTGIDRATGTVREGILYSREVFEEGARFAGVIKFPDESPLITPFENFVRQMGNKGLIRIGNGRSRGMGKIELEIPEIKGRVEEETFKQRLERFNDALYQLLQLPKPESAPFYFALTLHSPTILLDSLLCYRGSIDVETLCDVTHLSAGDFKLICQIAGVRRVTGWSELWGTPRTNEYAIEAGSVFLFAFTGNGEKKDLYEKLFYLEDQSIGQRRGEGFGRVCISDPFHLEGRG